MPHVLYALAIPLFTAADRGIGGLFRRSYVYGALLLIAAALTYFKEYPAAIITVVWGLYRSLPWKIGGSTTPRTAEQIIGAFLRHLSPSLAVFICWQQFGVDPKMFLPFGFYAVIATGLAYAYGRDVDAMARAGIAELGQVNEKVELVRGFVFGVAAAVALIIA